MKHLLLFLILSCCSVDLFSQSKITIEEAESHIGDTVTLCEKVFSGRFHAESGITFLNIAADYPYQKLAVVIKNRSRSKFKFKPEEEFNGKNICVTGKVQLYRAKPQIVVTDPKQIVIVD